MPIDPTQIVPYKSPSPPSIGNNPSRQQLKQARKDHRPELERLKQNKNYDPYLAKSYEMAGSQFNSVILPTSKAHAWMDNRQKYIGQLGSSDSFKTLVTNKKGIPDYIKTNCPDFQSFPKTVQDHLWNVFYRELIELPRDKGRSINTTDFLNSAREYAKQGQVLDRPIAELKTSHIHEVAYSLLELSRNGMWDYAYEDYPDNIEFLAQNGDLEVLQRAYIDNESVAVSEMSAFSQKFNLEEVSEAPFLIFVLKHAFIRAAFCVKELRDESNVELLGSKFNLSHIIDSVIVKHHEIKNVIDCVMRDLNLPENHIMRIYVDAQTKKMFNQLNSQGEMAIFEYRINMKEFDLPNLTDDDLEYIRILLYNGSATESVIDESIALKEIDEFNEIQDLKIGKYNSRDGLQSFDRDDYSNQRHMYYQTQNSETRQDFSFVDQLSIKYAVSNDAEDIAMGVAAISSISKSIKEQAETEGEQDEQDESSNASNVGTESNPEEDQLDGSVSVDDGAPIEVDVAPDSGTFDNSF